MKIKTLIICCFSILLFGKVSVAQEATFQTGWYIIQEGAKYYVQKPSGVDFDNSFDTKKGCYDAPDAGELTMMKNEVVLVFLFSENKYYCFDVFGRTIVFKGTNSLKKASESEIGVITLNKNITLPNDEGVLKAESYYWCIKEDGQNYTLQLAGDKTCNIKQKKVVMSKAANGTTLAESDNIEFISRDMIDEAKEAKFKVADN